MEILPAIQQSPYELEFEIEGLPKTTNAMRRAHWSVHSRHANMWQLRVANAVQKLRPNEPLSKAKLTLTRCSSNEPDFDGLVSSFKNCIDSLVNCGVLVNDKVSNIGQPEYKWEYAKKGRGKIRIKVLEVKQQHTEE